MAEWDFVSDQTGASGVYTLDCGGSMDARYSVYEGSSGSTRHLSISCFDIPVDSVGNFDKVGEPGDYPSVLQAAQSAQSGTTSDSGGLDEFGQQFISEFQPWVVESFSYALIIGLSMGWAGSFLYRRLRG